MPPEQMTLPLGLPDLPFHLRIDPLAGFFLLLLGSVSAGVSVYAAGYFRDETAGRLSADRACSTTCSSPAWPSCMLADDAYLFMVAWETMALSSYFLVTTDHKLPRDPQRRISLPADRAPGRDRDPAVLRRAARRPRRLHVRRAARRGTAAALGHGRVPARVLRLRRQGRHDPAARLAAGSAPGRALAGVGADERHHAQDRHLRHGARDLRPHRRRPLGMGPARAG